MAVLAKAGTASWATIASELTHPNASSRGIWRAGSSAHASRTTWRAVASGIMAGVSGLALPGRQVGDQATHTGGQLGTLEGVLEVGSEVVELVAGVVTAPVERVPVDLLGLQKQADGVGQLEL